MQNLIRLKYCAFLVLILLSSSVSKAYTFQLDSIKSKEYKPLLGLGSGYFTYFGEINNRYLNDPFAGYFAHSIELSRGILPHFDLGLRVTKGVLSGYNNPNYPGLNFRSEIFMGQVHAQYFFNTRSNTRNIVRPFLLLGFESYEFNPKADLYDAEGREYHYWDDGSIRNIDQNAQNSQAATILHRDYVYESDLREQNLDSLGKYPLVGFGIPIGLGFSMAVSDRISFQLNSTFHYTFNDNVDNISEAGLGDRKGKPGGDHFLHTYASLHYDLLTNTKSLDENDLVFPDFYALDMEDFDKDRVPNHADLCELTPRGVEVDMNGCPIDTDKDGVPTYMDDELTTLDTAYVNENGVTLTDEDFHYQYLTYIDSLEIPREVLGRMINRKEKKGIYRVRGGRYKGSVPDHELEVYVNDKDFRAHQSKEYIDYMTRRYFDLKNAERRLDSLENLGIENPEIVVEFENDFITLEEYQEILRNYDVADSLNLANQINKLEGQFVNVLGETANNANNFEVAKFFEEETPIVYQDENLNKNYLVNPTTSKQEAEKKLEEINKEKFPDAKVMKVLDGELVDVDYERKQDIIRQHQNEYAIELDIEKRPERDVEEIRNILNNEKLSNEEEVFGDFSNDPKVLEEKLNKLKELGYEGAEIVKFVNDEVVPLDELAVYEALNPETFSAEVPKEVVKELPLNIQKKLKEEESVNNDGSVTIEASNKEELNKKLERYGLKNHPDIEIKSSYMNHIPTNNDDLEVMKEGDFAVKVAEFNGPVSQDVIDKLSSIEGVQSIEEKDGTIYVVGSDKSIEEVKKKLEELKDAGFVDATIVKKQDGEIVDVPKEEYMTPEEIKQDEIDHPNVNNNTIEDHDIITKETVFRVQIGAYRNKIPKSYFGGVDVVSFPFADGITRYYSGSFKTYKEAAIQREYLKSKGYGDAFITAFKDGKKVPVSELLNRNDYQYIKNNTPDNSSNLSTENNTPSPKANELTANTNEHYTIQLGSFSTSPDKNKLNLDNVKIINENGSYKLLYGTYSNYNEALNAQKKLINEGFENAFIVHYKNGNRINVSNGSKVSNVEYNTSLLEIKVQVGSFTGSVPNDQLVLIESLREVSKTYENGVLKYYAGSFTNYEDANAYKQIVINSGIKDAFLVAFYNGEKISLQRALIILNK